MKLLSLGTLFLLVFTSFFSSEPTSVEPIYNQANQDTERWVDSVMLTLSTEEKVVQLFSIRLDSQTISNRKVAQFLEENSVGFLEGTVPFSRDENAKIAPMLMLHMADLEGLLKTKGFDWISPLSLASVQEDLVVSTYAESLGQWLRANNYGILAGVDGSVLQTENLTEMHFGQDKRNIYRTSKAFFKGLQEGGVLSALSGFPGGIKRGSMVDKTYNQLQSEEFFIFQSLLEDGIAAMDLEPFQVPALDSTQAINQSEQVITELLKEKWHYQGLVISKNFEDVDLSLKPNFNAYVEMLQSGADVIEVEQHPEKALNTILDAIADSVFSIESLNQKCRKVLYMKHWNEKSESNDAPTLEEYSKELIESSITLLESEEELLPIKRLDTTQIALVSISDSPDSVLLENMQLYAPTTGFHLGFTPTAYEIKDLNEALRDYNLVVLSLQDFDLYQEKEVLDLLDELSENFRTILIWNASPLKIRNYEGVVNHSTVLLTWGNSAVRSEITGQMLFGGMVPTGKISYNAHEIWPNGFGRTYQEKIRLKYGDVATVNFSEKFAAKIDSIALNGIEEQAYPGCQLVIIKDGVVFYQKEFGHHTYENHDEVKRNDLYDLASITKIAASMISLMHLQDRGEISLDQTLGDLIPEWVGTTDYAEINLREMLAHQSGLKAWIPFYKQTLSGGVPRYDVYSKAQNDTYPHRVANQLFIEKNYPDSIVKIITQTELNERGSYKYSDLGYYFIQKIVEKKSGMSLEDFVEKTFYGPMGLSTMCYKPREQFGLEQIVPTEYDVFFRKQLVHGDVHDPGAAMMGGVGGHAGLFSTANDLAKLMQMYMNYGYYGGERFLKEGTVKEYTKCQFCSDPSSDNRRGAGFDKPVRDGGPGPTCECVSYASFGHTGFTGTIAWADPEENIVFVFLSNRVYPNANNKKLIRMGIRTEIMQAIYDGFNESEN